MLTSPGAHGGGGGPSARTGNARIESSMKQTVNRLGLVMSSPLVYGCCESLLKSDGAEALDSSVNENTKMDEVSATQLFYHSYRKVGLT